MNNVAAAANIVIADSVPANRTYQPIVTGLKGATFVDVATAATPAGQSTVVFDLRRPTVETPAKVVARLNLPIEVVDANGTTVVLDVFRFEGSWVVPSRATALQRANFETLVQNLVAHAVTEAYVRNADPVF